MAGSEKRDPGAWARADLQEPKPRGGGRGPRQAEEPAGEPIGQGDTAFPREMTRVSGRRILAHLADGVIYLLLWLVFAVPAALISGAGLIVALILLFPGQIAYYVLTQRRDGQSPGKRLNGVRVVDAAGRTPSASDLLARSIPLLIDYTYVIAAIAIASSPDRQRLGDRAGGTYVIDARPPKPGGGAKPGA